MDIDITEAPSSQQKSIISTLRSNSDLPFRDILSSEAITESLSEVPYNGRHNIYPPDVTLWAFLSQAFDEDQTLEAAVSRVIAFHLSQGRMDDISSNTAAFSKARSKFPEEIISRLARESAEQMEETVPTDWLWQRLHRMKLIDGSTVSMPDTLENQAKWPQPDSQKEGVGFPLARLVAVVSCATGAVLDLAIGPYSGKETGEHALLRQLMHVFKKGDIVVGDAYYGSWFLIAMLKKIGVDVIFPIHAARHSDFRRGVRLGKKDHVVEWFRPRKPEWMDQETYDSFPEKFVIREVSVSSSQKGRRTQSRIIVTTFLDPKKLERNELNAMYSCRWWVELDLRSIKTTLKMDILRGKTPAMVRKEIWAHILGYNLIRKIMAEAAFQHGKNPREMSFSLAFHVIKSFRDFGLLSSCNESVYSFLLKSIVRRKIGNRPGRSEPRVVKRRPKAFPRMQQPRSAYH